MKAEDFAAWLSAISGMSEAQRAEALAALEKAGAGGDAAAASAKQGRASAAPGGRAWNDRRRAGRGSGVSPLRGPRDRRLGPLARAFAVPLQELRAHLQRADQDADGASAQEGEMARSRARDDRGQEPGEDRGALRRPSDDGVPLAASVSARACQRQAAKLERDRRSGRNLHPRILQGPLVRSAAQGAQSAAERPGIRAFIRTTFPSSSPATGRARPSTRSCLRSTALRWAPRSPESSRRAIISSATAARRSPLSPAEPGFPSTPCPRRESRPPRRRTCTSTTSTPITAVSSNGSTASTASPPRTCPIISVGGALSKPGRQTRTAKLDQRRYRKRAIPTDNAIRAKR